MTPDRELEGDLGAVQMGLIYVNPEGPNGDPDPLASARDIRETFARMAMNDEETVALVAGGHTFGKAHGVADPDEFVGPAPEGASLAEQGLGWLNSRGKGHGIDTITSGIEGAWTAHPTRWDNEYFETLFGYTWQLTKSGAGAQQWVPIEDEAALLVPDAHDPSARHAPIMTTADLALRMDPEYEKISRRFLANPDEFASVFARAWYKLTHRDMGPYIRGLGALVPATPQLWQDPVPVADYQVINPADIEVLSSAIRATGLSCAQLVQTAWASAATFRGSDMRGGANGARIRLAPQRDWPVNNPAQLAHVLSVLESIQRNFNDEKEASGVNAKVSLADVIVLAGGVAIEDAAGLAGYTIKVPFDAGRTDAEIEHTDVASFAVLEPKLDGFRNYRAEGANCRATDALIDRAQLLTLSAPQMTVLVGGLRVLGANANGSADGVFTDRVGHLTNDFFVNLLDMRTSWSQESRHGYVGRDRSTGESKYTATDVDLVFGSNSVLRAIAEVYASDDAGSVFVADFVAAWTKVMNLDRFDLR